jgi:hypothetical protein
VRSKSATRHIRKLTVELLDHLRHNSDSLPDDGSRWRTARRISGAGVESAVNQIIDRCMPKSQQMRWAAAGRLTAAGARARRRCHPPQGRQTMVSDHASQRTHCRHRRLTTPNQPLSSLIARKTRHPEQSTIARGAAARPERRSSFRAGVVRVDGGQSSVARGRSTREPDQKDHCEHGDQDHNDGHRDDQPPRGGFSTFGPEDVDSARIMRVSVSVSHVLFLARYLWGGFGSTTQTDIECGIHLFQIPKTGVNVIGLFDSSEGTLSPRPGRTNLNARTVTQREVTCLPAAAHRSCKK